MSRSLSATSTAGDVITPRLDEEDCGFEDETAESDDIPMTCSSYFCGNKFQKGFQQELVRVKLCVCWLVGGQVKLFFWINVVPL